MIREGNDYYSSFEAATIVDDIIYYVDISCNEVYAYSLKTKELVLLCKIEEELTISDRLFSDIVYLEGKLYLIPYSPDSLYIIDLDSHKYDVKPFRDILNKYKGHYLSTAKFSSGIAHEGNIYMIPATVPGILIYNCASDSFNLLDEWVAEVDSRGDEKELAYAKKTIIHDDKLYMPLCKMNGVVVIDFKTEKYEIKFIGDIDDSFSAICYDGNYFWLSPRCNGAIIKWKERDGSFTRINDFPKEYKRGSTMGIEQFDNNIYVFPQNSNCLLKINKCFDTVELYKKEKIEHRVLWEKKDKFNIYFFDAEEYSLSEISNAIPETKLRCLECMDEEHSFITSRFFREKNKSEKIQGIYLEDYENALSDFLTKI